MAKKETAEQKFNRWMEKANTWAGFLEICDESECVRTRVTAAYKSILQTKNSWIDSSMNKRDKSIIENFNADDTGNIQAAANVVWRTDRANAINILYACSGYQSASVDSVLNSTNEGVSTDTAITYDQPSAPFDRRLARWEQVLKDGNLYQKLFTPYDTAFAQVSTAGYMISEAALMKLDNQEQKAKLINLRKVQYNQMVNDKFYTGLPALQNPYALITLYGSQGGQRLVNKKGERRWYEVDTTADSQYNFASVPTTTAIISWGDGDPHGRTPYHFTDFVFAKYWKRIENNRLITLRRYAAPILDNLNFPGSEGNTDAGTSESNGNPKEDQGSNKGVEFPPMATAITYFGGDTGNSLRDIMKFSTGVLWDEVQADVWTVETDSVPENAPQGEQGSLAGKLFGGVGKFAEILNVAGGNFNREQIMNSGQLPPDPYENGPYENRIHGPINRIDTVKKRKPGLDFKWEGLNLVFEYVARPVGGINTKAVLLDILSNFLVIGSASAVFFGGAHRFMIDPAKYPFLGGGRGMEKWYRGEPVGWALEAIKDFTGSGGVGQAAASNFLKSAKAFFDQLLSGEKGSGLSSILNLVSSEGAGKNIINNYIAKKTAGQIPYLRGLRAILTGEPVGEWHVTVGNPLNPIAMIGNLICEGIDVEFNEELGPDDFPTEIKIVVRLKHGMARDKDSIQSIFNRGMGRIYSLPESFLGTADQQTIVDEPTRSDKTGTMPGRKYNVKYTPGLDSGWINKDQVQGLKEINDTVMGGQTSVWNRASFKTGLSENADVQPYSNEILRSSYRSANWIAQRAHI